MKKILSLIFTIFAFLVVALANTSPVFATTEDDYYDLFYEFHEVTFTATTTSTTTTFDYDPDDILFIVENLEYLYQVSHTPESITYNSGGTPYELEYIDVQEYTYGPGTKGIRFVHNNETTTAAQFRIWNESSGVESSFVIQQGPPAYFDESEVEFKVTFKFHKPWTQSYSYGRFRSETPGLDLWHDTTNGAVYLVNEGQTSGKLDLTQFDLENDESFKVVFQAPYTDFKVSRGVDIYAKTNVAVVEIEFTKISGLSPYKMSVDAYYWDGGEVKLHLGGKNENLNSTQASNLQVQFHGGYRSTISGDAVVIADVDNAYTLDHYLEFFKAWDDIDGDISDLIYVIEDDYTGNESVLGSYDVTIGVEDSEGNEATLEFVIMVVDVVEPTGPSTSSVTNVSYTSTYNLTNYISSYIRPNFTDNYDDPSDLVITVKTDGYTSTKSVPGNKTVIYSVKDTSGNETLHTLTIQVVDNVGPVFTGGLETLNKSVNETITTAQILATQVAMDAVDGNVSSSIIVVSNTYSGNETTPGSYEIIIRAFDSQNNQTTRTITIEVYSGVPSFWIPNDGPIIIPDGTTLTLEQIKSVLTTVQWIPMDVEVTLLSSDYFGNEETPGSYYITLSVGGTPITFDLLVLNDGDNWFPDVPNPPVQATTPNFALIVGVSVGFLAIIGVAAAVIIRKKKSKA